MIYLVVFLILVFIIAPLSLLFHEVGHLVGAALMGATSIRLTIGLGKPLWQATFANIQIIIRRFFLFNSVTSTVRTEPFTTREKIVITSMGPMFSATLTIIAFIAYNVFVQTDILYLFFLFNLWLLVINLIPFKIGQKQSDGYTILKLIIDSFKRKHTNSI